MSTKLVSLKVGVRKLRGSVIHLREPVDEAVQKVFLILSLQTSQRERQLYLGRFIQANVFDTKIEKLRSFNKIDSALQHPGTKLELFIFYYFLKSGSKIIQTPAEIDHFHKFDFLLSINGIDIGLDLTLMKDLSHKRKKQLEHSQALDKKNHVPRTITTQQELDNWNKYPLNNTVFSQKFLPDTIGLLKIFNKKYGKYRITYSDIINVLQEGKDLTHVLTKERHEKYSFISKCVTITLGILIKDYNNILTSSNYEGKIDLGRYIISVDKERNEIHVTGYEGSKTQRTFLLILPITKKMTKKINKNHG